MGMYSQKDSESTLGCFRRFLQHDRVQACKGGGVGGLH